MFWKFGGFANFSTIDNILERDNFQLEELLEESDLIQELKNHNGKLVEYLREPVILEKLLEYVIAPKLEPVAAQDEDEKDDEGKGKGIALPFTRPRASSTAAHPSKDEEEVEKKRNRYAFVAAEILSSDNWSIYESFMENKHLLQNFWQFLKRPAPLDPLQASYFTKVNESLFDKKTEEMIELLKSLENAVSYMIKHVDSPMIMDLLLKIISLERTENGRGIVEWLYTQNVMPTLLSFLGPEHSWATQTSAGDFMKAIITISANASQNEEACIGPNELTRQLVSKPCVEQLIQYMLGGGNPLTVGVGIVIEVIRKNNSDYDPDGVETSTVPSSRDPIYLGILLRLFAQHVPDFMRLITKASAQKEWLGSTFGKNIEPLGFDRFKTCELMAELLHCSNMALLNEAGAEDLIAARDAERQRLRVEGRLMLARGEEAPSSAEGLTMRMSHSSPISEGRRLEVTNISADDDGFEEVTHGGDEDASHGVEDLPELPEAPSFPSGEQSNTSFFDKDEDDFVDEPLSSPRLYVRDLDDNADEESGLEDPELVVAPLSPSKSKTAAPTNTTSDSGKVQEDVAETSHSFSPESKTEAEPERRNGAALPRDSSPQREPATTSSQDAETLQQPQETGQSLPVERAASPVSLSPYPADAPEPLFSKPRHVDNAANETKSAGSSPKPQIVEQASTMNSDEMDLAEEDHQNKTSTSRDASVFEARIDSRPARPIDDSPAQPVVGDYLKMQFVEHGVVPTILGFFFAYPWNNFLHNVVYDIVQQVFNGPMDRGFNPTLALSLFKSADITIQIINGQRLSEESQAQHRTRMGYMGHLTLIAEEVVKFTERHPPEMLKEPLMLERVMSQDWIKYVEGPLAETRERDNAVLGGVRPQHAMSQQASAAGMGLSGLNSLGLTGNAGGSSALADAGLNGGSDLQENPGGNGVGPFNVSAGTMMSGFGSSSDEEDDEEPESEGGVNHEFRAYIDPLNANQSASLNPPSIPPPPPPSPPLNIAPSRARLQLAARLAMNKRIASGSNGQDCCPVDQETGTGTMSLPNTSASARLRNPFADDDEDEDANSGSGSSDEGEGDNGGGSVGSSGWNRGSWWRGVVRSARRRSRGQEAGDDEPEPVECFGDGRDDSEYSPGGSDLKDDDIDDEEFGEFAMPEVGDMSGETGTQVTGRPDPSREKILLKPPPVHPSVSKSSSVSSFGSLWPFSTQGFGAGKDKEEKDGEERSTTELREGPALRGEKKLLDPMSEEVETTVLGEDGKKINRAVQAKRRTSIEDPDDEDDELEVGDIIAGTA